MHSFNCIFWKTEYNLYPCLSVSDFELNSPKKIYKAKEGFIIYVEKGDYGDFFEGGRA